PMSKAFPNRLAAIATKNIGLGLKYAEEWRRIGEENNLEGDVLRSGLVIQILHLLLGDADWCSGNIERFSDRASEEWRGVVTFVSQWVEAVTRRLDMPPDATSWEPYPLFLGLEWRHTGPLPAEVSSGDFEILCQLRRQFSNPSSATDRLSLDQILDYASLVARWELPRPLHEIEAILRGRSSESYYNFCTTRILGKYASKEVTNKMSVHSAIKTRDSAIIWMMDVRGYSRLTEQGSAESAFQILSPLFKIMNEELETVGGTIHEFVGDSIMVVFDAFNHQKSEIMDILYHTVQCLTRIHVLNSLSLPTGMPELNIGVGINKGNVATGYLGGLVRCHLTILGNTVNIAARMEGLTKDVPGAVLVSRACFDGQEPDVWSTPLKVNFTLRDVGRFPMKNISKPPNLYSVGPLLRHWIDFVPMGFVGRPEKGVVYIDTGNSGEPGIIDHHYMGYEAKSACELLVQKPELLLGHVQDIPSSQIEFRLHEQPDLDCAATLYIAYELMDRAPRKRILRKLANYVSKVDQGAIPQPDRIEESLYGIFIAHQKIVEKNLGHPMTDALRLEAGIRVIDAAFYLLEKSEHGGDFSVIFQLQPNWFAEERALIREDRASYNEDLKLRSRLYKAHVKGLPEPVSGLWLDHPESIFFKLWARNDRKAPGGEGHAFLAVDWSEPAKNKNRFVISVDPESGTSLEGLGELLERLESSKRKGLKQERPLQPIRHPSDNSDPWYFGWSHQYTIIDSPRAGTALTAEEVRKIHEEWVPE
ncbi:adenylate/guanylate cyclase domain-containing protein, partial [Thermodesulfobacteriota bacterium]